MHDVGDYRSIHNHFPPFMLAEPFGFLTRSPVPRRETASRSFGVRQRRMECPRDPVPRCTPFNSSVWHDRRPPQVTTAWGNSCPDHQQPCRGLQAVSGTHLFAQEQQHFTSRTLPLILSLTYEPTRITTQLGRPPPTRTDSRDDFRERPISPPDYTFALY